MRSLVLLTCLAFSMDPVPARQGRDGGQAAIAVSVDLVVFNVSVTDGNGRYVPGLTARDFQVLEERHAQDIKLFVAEDAPISIGLVIDRSGSMRDKRAEVMSAALAFTAASHPEDELFVVSFNENASLGLPPSMPFTHDIAEIRSALLGINPVGMTALYDALVLSIEHVQTGTHNRKALVVLSDGGDNTSRSRLEDVIRLAQRCSATIYAVGIYEETDRDRNPRALRTIAGINGGRAYFPETLHDMDGVWRDIANRIRSQYTLGYYSSNPRRDGAFRRVEVKVTRPDGHRLRVTTRDGYRAPGDLSSAK